MKNKKQQKRYTIILESGFEIRNHIGQKYLKELKQKVYEYNSNPKNPYYFGKFQIDENKKQIIIPKYKKITIKTTLEEIDNSTTNFKGEHELKTLYNIDVKNPRHLYIAYRADKEVRLLPIIYKNNKKYLDKTYLKKQYSDLGRDINFLNKLLNDKEIEHTAITSYGDLDYLYALKEKVKHELPALVDTYPIEKFFDTFVSEKGKFRYFNLRLLTNLIIEYNKETDKEELENDEEIIGQMAIEDMCMKYLRDLYEDMKIAVAEGTLSEVYSKKLIQKP